MKNYAKKILIFALSVFSVVLISACTNNSIKQVNENDPYPNPIVENAQISDLYKDNAQRLSEDAINEFLAITKIPRKSGHMDAIRNYLMTWAQDHHVKAALDQSGCVYYDLDATSSRQNYPAVILQVHMDMVVSNDPSYTNFDPLVNHVEPDYNQENGEIHSKDYKTNIGADDGQGLGLCLALAKADYIEHGPVRLLFTYDEEISGDGSRRLTPSVLNTDYLINFDAPRCGIAAVGCAGILIYEVNKSYIPSSVPNDMQALDISVSKLKGGHSGTAINKNRNSGSSFCAQVLKKLKDNNIFFRISDIDCGQNINSIPEMFNIKLYVDKNNSGKAEELINNLAEDLRKEHSDDSNFVINIKNLDSPSFLALTNDESTELLSMMSTLPNGVMTMSDSFQNTPETSNNIGIINLNNGNFILRGSFRSSNNDTLQGLYEKVTNDFKQYSAKVIFNKDKDKPGYTSQNQNFADLYLAGWETQCGFKGSKIVPHAAMELTEFLSVRPSMNMISVGADIKDEHALTETFYTKSYPVSIVPVLYVFDNINTL